MKYCGKCCVEVRGSAVCPLCGARLEGEPEPPVYPRLSRKISPAGWMLRLLTLITASAGVACLAINGMLPESGGWSLYVVLGIGSFWISFGFLFRHKTRFPRLVTEQAVVLWGLCLFWDGITGWRGWSLEFTWPILFSAAMLVLGIVCRARRIPSSEFVVCQCMNAVMGVIPSFLYMGGAFSQGIPSLISGALGGILLVSMLVFHMPVMKREFSRRMHI